MKIYTRTGDDGTTGLPGGQRVAKSHARLTCCGDLDELSAAIGLACTIAHDSLWGSLHDIQGDLLSLGAHVADPDPDGRKLPELRPAMVARLEAQIDAAENQLPPLRQFILAGGTDLAARLHLARTICRRAERSAVAVAAGEPVPPLLLPYLNRLADWLFVMARSANHMQGVPDIPWTGR